MRKIEIATVQVSTQFKNFGPESLLDGDKKFGGWISAVGDWQNSWIEFHFVTPSRVRAVEICNGFVEEFVNRTREDYYFHLRVEKLLVSFSPGYGSAGLHVKDDVEPQVFEIESVQNSISVRITILSVFRETPLSNVKPFDVVGLRHVEWYA